MFENYEGSKRRSCVEMLIKPFEVACIKLVGKEMNKLSARKFRKRRLSPIAFKYFARR